MNEGIEVLIVEDDIRIAEIHRRFTEKIEGFKVIGTATTGEQAKEWLEFVKPQLVLLDVYLPDMQGTELVTYIRHNLHDTDIIMITAASETDVVRHALRGGVTDYIVKPLTFDRFKTSLESYQKKITKLKKNTQLSSEQIEHLWSQRGVQANQIEYAPKGIDPLTLAKIKKHMLTINEEGITCRDTKFNGRCKPINCEALFRVFDLWKESACGAYIWKCGKARKKVFPRFFIGDFYNNKNSRGLLHFLYCFF